MAGGDRRSVLRHTGDQVGDRDLAIPESIRRLTPRAPGHHRAERSASPRARGPLAELVPSGYQAHDPALDADRPDSCEYGNVAIEGPASAIGKVEPARQPGRATVRFDTGTGDWYLGDYLQFHNGCGEIAARTDELVQYLAADMLRALRAAQRHGHFVDTVVVTEFGDAFFDDDTPVDAVSFGIHDSALVLKISFSGDFFDDDGEPDSVIGQILAPLLRRERMTLLDVRQDDDGGSQPWLWHARLAVTTRGRTLGAIFTAGHDAIALLTAMDSGRLTRLTVADLVRGGHARALIGHPEGHWLDVKSQHYDLGDERGKISLAQAVARFCNAETGGLVVVGMNTKKTGGGEEIRGLCPMPLDEKMTRRYQQVLETRLFPPPDGLTIESIHMGGGMLMLIDIPPQPEELKPFLVHGAIVDGRVEGAIISIVRRRGESSIPITAPMIHSALAAGRALLRRGELPASTGPRAPGSQANSSGT